MQGNLCPKLPKLPQKHHNIDCSLIFISTAKHRSTLYTQYCFYLICVLARINFYILYYQAYNFSCYDRAGQAGITELLGHCSPPHTHQFHTPTFSTEHSQNLRASLYTSKRVVLKKASCFSLANTALLVCATLLLFFLGSSSIM